METDRTRNTKCYLCEKGNIAGVGDLGIIVIFFIHNTHISGKLHNLTAVIFAV